MMGLSVSRVVSRVRNAEVGAENKNLSRLYRKNLAKVKI